MCKCTPEIRTPFCGKPGCEWPHKQKPDNARGNDMTTDFIKRIERLKKVGFSWFDSEIRQDRETLEWAASELVRLRGVLSEIADQGIGQQDVLNMPNDNRYAMLFLNAKSKARAALNNRSDEDAE